jgi:hypothetical protein
MNISFPASITLALLASCLHLTRLQLHPQRGMRRIAAEADHREANESGHGGLIANRARGGGCG